MADVPTPGAAPTPGEDWPAQAADTIVKVIGTVRDKTTGTAVTAARGVVFGLLAALLGVTAGMLGLIGAMRLLVVLVNDVLGLLDQDRPGRAVWIVDLVLGLAFVFAGLFLWKKATAAPAAE